MKYIITVEGSPAPAQIIISWRRHWSQEGLYLVSDKQVAIKVPNGNYIHGYVWGWLVACGWAGSRARDF